MHSLFLLHASACLEKRSLKKKLKSYIACCAGGVTARNFLFFFFSLSLFTFGQYSRGNNTTGYRYVRTQHLMGMLPVWSQSWFVHSWETTTWARVMYCPLRMRLCGWRRIQCRGCFRRSCLVKLYPDGPPLRYDVSYGRRWWCSLTGVVLRVVSLWHCVLYIYVRKG